jgi:hypothetical protein
VRRQKLVPDSAAWDLLAIALGRCRRRGNEARHQPDGWTRELELNVALHDSARWEPFASSFSSALAFLTTDRWQVAFRGGGAIPKPSKKPRYPDTDSVVLLSGGLDSLIGAIDLAANGFYNSSLSVRQCAETPRSRIGSRVSSAVASNTYRSTTMRALDADSKRHRNARVR